MALLLLVAHLASCSVEDPQVQELGEGAAVSAAQLALAEQLHRKCAVGKCSLADIKSMYTNAWHAGYGSGHQDAKQRPAENATAKAPCIVRDQTSGASTARASTSRASWGCQNNSVYASEWIVRDQYSGCFIQKEPLVDESKRIDLTVVIKDVKGPQPPANTQYWSRWCSNMRRQASVYLLRAGECEIKAVSPKTRDDFNSASAWGGYKGEAWPTKCGIYQQDRHPGQESPIWLKSANWTGSSLAAGLMRKTATDPLGPDSRPALVYLKKATEHIAGKCLSQSVLQNYGRGAGEILPGQCLKSSGQCACQDGYQVPVASTYSMANNAFRKFQQMQDLFELFAELLCFDAPGFHCVIPPAGGWTNEIQEKCKAKFKPRIKPSFNVVKPKSKGLKGKGKGLKAGVPVQAGANLTNTSVRLGEAVTPTPAQGSGNVASHNFRTWAASKLKVRLSEFPSVGYLLNKWTSRSEGKETVLGGLNSDAVRTWLWDRKTWKDAKRPLDGMSAQLLQGLGVSQATAAGYCSIADGFFSKESDYEKTIITKTALDTKVDFSSPQPTNDYLQMWSITALPKFWRRAASVRESGVDREVHKETRFSCLPIKYGSPAKEANLFREESPVNSAKDAPNRKVVFGCPDAVPELAGDHFEWRSSGTGEDFVTAHYPHEGPLLKKGDKICSMQEGEAECKAAGLLCAHRLSFKQTACSTCCCKDMPDGLVASNVKSQLVFGNINECGRRFSLMDGQFRTFVSAHVSNWSLEHLSPACHNPTTIQKSNSEICQRFKCEAKKPGAEEPLKQPSKATLGQLCGDYKCL